MTAKLTVTVKVLEGFHPGSIADAIRKAIPKDGCHVVMEVTGIYEGPAKDEPSWIVTTAGCEFCAANKQKIRALEKTLAEVYKVNHMWKDSMDRERRLSKDKDNKIAELEGKLAAVKLSRDSLRTESIRVRKELDAVKGDLVQAGVAITERTKELERLKDERGKLYVNLRTELEDARVHSRALETGYINGQEAMEKAQRKTAFVIGKLDAAQTENAELKRVLNAERRASTAEWDQLRSKLDKSEKTIADLKAKLGSCEKRIAEMTNQRNEAVADDTARELMDARQNKKIVDLTNALSKNLREKSKLFSERDAARASLCILEAENKHLKVNLDGWFAAAEPRMEEVRLAEREACARVVEKYPRAPLCQSCSANEAIAEAIRMRESAHPLKDIYENWKNPHLPWWKVKIADAVEAEREACAKVLDYPFMRHAFETAAQIIRKRENP